MLIEFLGVLVGSFLILGYLRGLTLVFSVLTIIKVESKIKMRPLKLLTHALLWPISLKGGDFVEVASRVAVGMLDAEIRKLSSKESKDG